MDLPSLSNEGNVITPKDIPSNRFNMLEAHRTQSEDDVSTPKLTNDKDDSFQHSEARRNVQNSSKHLHGFAEPLYPVNSPHFTQAVSTAVPKNPNRFLMKTQENLPYIDTKGMKNPKMFNRAGSMPVIYQGLHKRPQMANFYKDFVKIEKLSNSSQGKDNAEPINRGRFTVKDKTPKTGNSTKMKEPIEEEPKVVPPLDQANFQLPPAYLDEFKLKDQQHPTTFTELSSDFDNKGEYKPTLERYESNTADGIHDRIPNMNGSNYDHIPINPPGYNDIEPLASNKSSECRSHPPPLTDFQHPIPPMNEMMHPNQEFFFEEKGKYDNKSFEKKIEGQNINRGGYDLKSFTQPINSKYLAGKEEEFGYPGPSPNSHPANTNLRSNSFLDGASKQNRFKITGTDETRPDGVKQSVSDPNIPQYTDYHESSKGLPQGKFDLVIQRFFNT